VLEYKKRKLEVESPRCDRRAVSFDLRNDWPSALRQAGLEAKKPTLWVVEGLLQDVRATDFAVIGHEFGRWSFPVVPRGTPGVPHSFLVRAIKRASASLSR
jgi:O-methyltransferase involved in polyketide biosynthesis